MIRAMKIFTLELKDEINWKFQASVTTSEFDNVLRGRWIFENNRRASNIVSCLQIADKGENKLYFVRFW